MIPNRTRNKDGRFRKKRSDAGKPRGSYINKIENYCPKCGHYTLEPKGKIQDGTLEVWSCSRCNYRCIRKEGDAKDAVDE